MTLDDLKLKWFIDPSISSPDLPPTARHSGSDIAPWTDGNLVTFYADGQNYMKAWNEAVTSLTSKGSGEIFHAGWRFENVRTLGTSNPASGALDMYMGANKAGVSIYVLLSYHGLGLASAINEATSVWLIANGVTTACYDARSPLGGSSHQKAVVIKHVSGSVALLGSIDISKTRWDTSAHLYTNPERDQFWAKNKPTHDSGVQITGPAVADIERSFRERWNDSSRRLWMMPLDVPQPMIASTVAAPVDAGTQSVQVLRTYGITGALNAYTWHDSGEFTLWAAYLNAVKKSQNYIYIEDQYFLPFGAPPFCSNPTPGPALDYCPVYQIGQRLKAGVRVVLLIPSNAEDQLHDAMKYHRDLGLQYLFECDAGKGNLAVVSLEVNRNPVYVHSKLLLVDDEYVLIGSSNVGQRSMTCDGELSVGIVDGPNAFVQSVRTTLWSEHLQMAEADVKDVAAGFDAFRRYAGHARPYPYGQYPDGSPSIQKPPLGYSATIDSVIDPYYGPPR